MARPARLRTRRIDSLARDKTSRACRRWWRVSVRIVGAARRSRRRRTGPDVVGLAVFRSTQHVLRVRAKESEPGMIASRRETHTTVCCAHPYFGFVCTPNTIIDFSDRVPAEFNHPASATIDVNGFRNEGVPVSKPDDEFWIGVFGGSVAFGVPATDNGATIAGCLERRLNTAASAPTEFRSIFGAAGGVSATTLALEGARRWADDTALMGEVCRARGIESLFVVQPIPDRAKALTGTERAHLEVQPDIVAI